MSEQVSIIVPLYNAAPYIAETLRSLLAQTYSDFLVYVVDDLSTDESPAIVKQLAQEDTRVQYHRMSQKGGRPAPTKNEGVRLAKGQYIAFCDHDDWWAPNKLERQVAYMEDHPEVTLLGCNVEIVDTERNKSLGNFWSNPHILQKGDLRHLVLEGPILATTTCLLGRAAYLKQHPFDETYIGADEYDLSLHAVLDNSQQVALLPETLAYWRWHESSLSHSAAHASRAAQDEEYFAEKLLARGDLTPEEEAQVKDRLWMVRRRSANSLLVAGKRAEARRLYQAVLKESRGSERAVKLILFLDRLVPPLARWLVAAKKQYSYVRPTFR